MLRHEPHSVKVPFGVNALPPERFQRPVHGAILPGDAPTMRNAVSLRAGVPERSLVTRTEMPDEPRPLINIDVSELSKPANTFIEKVSDAVGGLCRPWQIRRLAEAEADARLITAQMDVQITALQQRAMHRFMEEEARKQENMESIAGQALRQIEENAKPEKMDNDWITNFFEKCRLVSDKEMQQIWSRILAGEANAPGSFAKRTVALIEDLDKSDALLFETLCRFICRIAGAPSVIVFDSEADIYKEQGIKFHNLTHLDTLGLISFDKGFSGGFSLTGSLSAFPVSYHGVTFCLEPKVVKDRKTITAGRVMLTQAGAQLARICQSKPVDGFVEYLKQQWADYLPKETPVQNPPT